MSLMVRSGFETPGAPGKTLNGFWFSSKSTTIDPLVEMRSAPRKT